MQLFVNIWRFKKKFFHSILNKKIEINEEVNFGSKKTNSFFKKKIKKSRVYFEYGSGSSTIIADKENKYYNSIELDKSFYLHILKRIKKKNSLNFVNIGPVGEFSYPLFLNLQKIKEYINSVNIFFKKKTPNLILIDGRFRVACCLNLLRFKNKLIKNKTTIILDDFKKRKEYGILNDFFFIKKIDRFAILKFKKKKLHYSETLKKYYLDPR